MEAPRRRGDLDAPDVELTIIGRDSHAFLAYYDDEERAGELLPSIRKSTRRAGLSVESRGRLTIVWKRGRATEEAETIRECTE